MKSIVTLVATCLAIAMLAAGAGFAQTSTPSPAEELARRAESAARSDAVARPSAPASFVLRRVVTGPSAYLPAEQLQRVARTLEGQRVTTASLGAVTAAFDALYDAAGIALAQSAISRVDPARGIVEVVFIEARVGAVDPRGSLASPDFYRARIGLVPGALADNRVLEENLLRLAIASGIRSTVNFTPGAEPGFTNLTVAFEEPPRFAAGLTLDTHGSDGTGRARGTLALSLASLTGNLDPLALSLTATEGLRSGAVSYARPIGTRGTVLFATMSGEASRTLRGPDIRGSNSLVEIGFSHPAIARPDRRLMVRGSVLAFGERRNTAGVPTTRQSGGGLSLGATYVHEAGPGRTLSLDGNLRHLRWDDGIAGLSGLSTTILTTEAAWLTPLGEGALLLLRGGAQGVAGSRAPVQLRGTVTSAQRVRGYPSGLGAGDALVWGSVQVRPAQPMSLAEGWSITPYAFVDAGRGFDLVGGTLIPQGVAVSAGLGSTFALGSRAVLDIFVAKPVTDVGAFSAAGAWRLEAALSLRF